MLGWFPVPNERTVIRASFRRSQASGGVTLAFHLPLKECLILPLLQGKYSAFRKISQQHHLKLLPLSRYFPDIAEVAHGRGVPISRVSLRMEGLTVCVSPQKFIGGLGGNISWRSLSHAQLQAPSPGRL